MTPASTCHNTTQPGWAPRVFLWSACVLVAWMGSGCDVAGIPSPSGQDAGWADVTNDQREQVCTPNARRCFSGVVIACNADGTVESEYSCRGGEACDEGYCKPVSAECNPAAASAHEEGIPFSVSTGQLVFETGQDLKKVTQSVTLTNCTSSTLTIDTLAIDDSNNLPINDFFERDGVFHLTRESDLDDVELGPFEERTIAVSYDPRYAFSETSHKRGKLEIITVDEAYRTHTTSIDLVPHTYCVTVTPAQDFGMIDDPIADRVYIQNCGNQPIELTGVSVEPSKEETLTNAVLELLEAESIEGIELASGEIQDVPFVLIPNSNGYFDQQIVFDLADPDRFADPTPATRIHGRVIPNSCTPNTIDVPTVWTEDDDGEGRRYVDVNSRWSTDVDLGSRVHFQMNPAPPLIGEPYFSLVTPKGSRAKLEAPSDMILPLGKLSFETDVAGTYEVHMNYLDTNSRPMCESESQPKVLKIFARPTADLYVDLQWTTLGDQIETDVGYGRGADLNLHLSATDDENPSPSWGDKNEGCLGFGEYVSSPALGGEIEERSERAGCDSSNATIRSLSVSGAHREIMTVEQTNRRYYHIGAQVWSIADYFPNAKAKITIYANGQPVDSAEWVNDDWVQVVWSSEDDPTWDNEPPPDAAKQNEMIGAFYDLGKDHFWRFAVWDAQEQELLLYPFRFFPNTFP